MNQIDNVENVVCSAETMSQHDELYHYTKPAAFEGIVRSQTLWCSHYREMRDTAEVLLMRDLLSAAIAQRTDATAHKLNRGTRRRWNAHGREASPKAARDLVNALYGATFDGGAVYSAFDAYLFSFSTHAEDSPIDREHGIRRQWDCYAGPEGYCLVFDIGELSQVLGREMDARYWQWLKLDPVRNADQPVENIFPELVDASAKALLRSFIDDVKLLPETTGRQFLAGATLLKGKTYKSEREVRIVAIPGTVETAKFAAKEYPDQFDATAPLPEVKTRDDTGKRYIALFNGLGMRLPVKRVIVGPGDRQEERAEHARSMLGTVPVSISHCT